MSISYINRASQAVTAGSGWLVVVPTSTVDGDLMVAFINSTDTISATPSGWTTVRNTSDASTAGTSWIGYKIASSEPASYAITLASFGNSTSITHTYRATGGWVATPLQLVTYLNDNAGLNTYDTPSISPTSACMAIAMACHSFNLNDSVTVGNGFTLRHPGASEAQTAMFTADKAVSAGATGTTTFTQNPITATHNAAGYQMAIFENLPSAQMIV